MTGLPEGFRKEGVILSLILFRCAKRSILPDKTTLLENELARLQSEFHNAKSQNFFLDIRGSSACWQDLNWLYADAC